MPRGPRIDFPGLISHVISRGVKQIAIFRDDEDRQRFLQILAIAKADSPFVLHNYSLMTNHFHLLMEMIKGSLSQTMQFIKFYYAQWFNFKYGLTGHLFQGRFHSIPVQEDNYLIAVSRYIDLNSVEARIVQRPEDYPWASYGRVVRGEADPLVDPRFILGYFGPDTARQREKYRAFVEEKINAAPLITEKALWRMRYWGDPEKIIRDAVARMPQ
jgi:putative transposase